MPSSSSNSAEDSCPPVNTSDPARISATARQVIPAASSSQLSKASRIRSSSSCSYLPILGGLSGPASPAEVTKEVAFGGVVDNTGRFSPRVVEGGEGYFSIKTTSGSGKAFSFGISNERESPGSPSGPRRIGSSASLVAAGSSGTILTKDFGRGEMITGPDSEGAATAQSHHLHFYHHGKPNSSPYETSEEVLLRVKTKAGTSTSVFIHQVHHSPLYPLQLPSSSMSLTISPMQSSGNVHSNLQTPTPLPAGITSPSLQSSAPAGGGAALPRTAGTCTIPRPVSRNSSRSSLRLRLPLPSPKVQVEGVGIGVHHIVLPSRGLFPTTPEGTRGERGRRESAPGLLVAGINPRPGGWLLTPPEEVGGMVWQCPTPDKDEEMIDRESELDVDMNSAKLRHASHVLDFESVRNRGLQTRDAGQELGAMERQRQAATSRMPFTPVPEELQPTKLEDDQGDDDEWAAGDEWLKDATKALLSCLSPVQIAQEAVRILSYSLPCPLPTIPDPSNHYMTVGASSASMAQGRLPASAAAAPQVAEAAGQQLSPAIVARCTSRANGASMALGGVLSRDGVTTATNIITSAIQRRYARDNSTRVYISVSHAIPPHIPLNRLPSVPPSLPTASRGGSASSGIFDSSFGASLAGDEGYFSPSVFNSIVVAQGGVPGTPTHLPHPLMLPPHPILPPNSLHISVLERFIPPESISEDANMFSPTNSIILDRLVELSNNGGSLLFIYPTKKGAKQFCRDILGPVLDPLLRRLMVLYRLKEDLLWRVRNMAAVEAMADWEQLQLRMKDFCEALNGGHGSTSPLAGKIPVEVAYASTARVRLNDESWREWWSQQEQMRIREIFKRHGANMPQLSTPTADSGSSIKKPADTSTMAPRGEVTIPLIPGSTGTQKAAVNMEQPAKKKRIGPSMPQLGNFPPQNLSLSGLPPFSPSTAESTLTPLSPEASAYYLGIRSATLSNSSAVNYASPYETANASTSPSNDSNFTMGYGAPGDLAREVLDGIRAPAVRPSSQGMGEAVVASAFAGSTVNSGIQPGGVGGVVGDNAWINRAKIKGTAVGAETTGNREQSIEVGVFVLRKGKRSCRER